VIRDAFLARWRASWGYAGEEGWMKAGKLVAELLAENETMLGVYIEKTREELLAHFAERVDYYERLAKAREEQGAAYPPGPDKPETQIAARMRAKAAYLAAIAASLANKPVFYLYPEDAVDLEIIPRGY
jgi:chorismate mutase